MNLNFTHRAWWLASVLACSNALAQSNPNPIPETATTALDIQVSMASDMRNRGVSDSMRRPGAKFSVQAAHESGVIGLLEIASVSKKQFLAGSGATVVAGLGYRFGDPEGGHFGVGLAGEWFPGASFEAPHALDPATFEPHAIRRSRYDSQFLLVEAGYGQLEGRLMTIISRSYRGADTGGVCGQLLQVSTDPAAGLACFARGDHGSRGTWLADLNYQVRLTAQSSLNLHAGRQQVKHFREADTSDFAVGLAHRRWGYTFTAEWLKVNARMREIYLVQDGSGLRATDNSQLVATVSRKF